MTAKWQYKRAYEAALEHNHELNAKNAKLRERIAELEELLPDSGRWFSAETVEAYVAEIAKLRELCSKFAQVVANDDVTFRKLREIAKRELGYDFIGAYDSSLGDMDQLPLFSDSMRELGIEVGR